MKNHPKSVSQLRDNGLVEEIDVDALSEVQKHFAISISPTMVEVIRGNPSTDPVAAQFVPTKQELVWDDSELIDPIGDAAHTPVKGIVHRYHDRVLLKCLHVCPVYCRFCFRREMVGPGAEHLNSDELSAALAYIAGNQEIFEVILTGGDPFIMSQRRLRDVVGELSNIPHVRVIRFHTRVPVVTPEIISPEFVDSLKSEKAVYVALHINHANELTDKAKVACSRLVDAGIPMVSQTVLLRGINDTRTALIELFRELVSLRIKPYYLHHGDLAKGTRHFRTSIECGQELMRELRGDLTGLAQPLYVIDIPGGYGKVPIASSYILKSDDGNYLITDPGGRVHPYSEVI